MSNKLKIILAAIIAVVLLVGCSKFLDEQPMGDETEEFFWLTEDHAVKAVTAVYDAAGWRFSQEISEFFLGDIVSDDAEKGGENAADWAELQHLKEFKGQPGNVICFERWRELYQGVYRANLVIHNVPGMTNIDTTLRARLVGEAQFLRAYFYFQLVKTYGRVPLILKPLTPDEYCQPRAANIDICWTQIEADLTQAAAVLPKKADTDLGRATLGAAFSLLAKAYIFQKKWPQAQQAAAFVIDSLGYQLHDNYADNFKLANENGIESVFEIQHIFLPTDEYGDLNEGQETSIYQGSRKSKWFEGWGFNCPTEDFVKSFNKKTDRRFKATVIQNGDLLWEGTSKQEKAENSCETGYGARKYILEYQPEVPHISNSPANWRVIRYSDVLLFHAEAACETNDLPAAHKSLNKVRVRAGLAPINISDQAALRDSIYIERRRELGLEGHRFFDLVRQGRAAAKLKNFTANKHDYFPIPQLEIDICPLVEQNPYY